MLKLLARLDQLPRQTIYIGLFIVAALPFIFPIRLPLFVWKESRAAWEIVDSCPEDKVIALNSQWVGGSQGENWPQYEAVVSHMMAKGIRFIVFSLDSDPLAPQMAEAINVRQARLYGREYGVDWVNLGLARGAPLTMASIGRSVKSVFQNDFYGTSTSDYNALPLMRQVETVRDLHALVTIDYQPSLDWFVFLDPTGQIPVIFGSAGIVTTSWYPYLATGQMDGMLAGVRGAAEYETLTREDLGDAYIESAVLMTRPAVMRDEEVDGQVRRVVVDPGQSVVISKNGRPVAGVDPAEFGPGWRRESFELRGRKLLVPLAFGYLIIIMLIVMGNVGMLAARKVRKREGSG